jgi:tetratricopeptide (TPR) repeat protein
VRGFFWPRRLSRGLDAVRGGRARRRVVAFVATLMCAAGDFGSASAADVGALGPDHQSSDPALREAYSRAFQAMLADPGNLDKALGFADLAIRTGDFEGAIAAFERMLLVDPNLPWAKLELGALYFRLGSFAMARTYLQDALTAPNLSPTVRDHIRALLAQIEQEEASGQFSGSARGRTINASLDAHVGPHDVTNAGAPWRF